MFPIGDTMDMKYEIRSTKQFDKWFSKLKDSSAKVKVLGRLNRLENGNFGDFKKLNPGLFELRFFFGAGFRIYYTIQNDMIVILLVGGDKSSQKKDIAKATGLLAKLEE